MQFSRTKLIALIDAEIQRRRAEASSGFRLNYQKYVQSALSYNERTQPLWEEFARNITNLVATEMPVDKSAVPAALWSRNGYELDFWSSKEPKESAARLDDLPAMKALLESVEDEKVSTAELQRMGFKVPDIFSGS